MHYKPATIEAGKDMKPAKSIAHKKRTINSIQEPQAARLTGTIFALEVPIMFDGAALGTVALF
jgi:hypothetical protein